MHSLLWLNLPRRWPLTCARTFTVYLAPEHAEMGAGMLIGGMLVAFGPAAALFMMYVWGQPAMLIISIASALSAFVSSLLTSFFWLSVPPLQDKHIWPLVIFPVMSECVRGAFFVGYMRIERMTDRMTSPSSPKLFVDLPVAVSCGCGSGLLLTIMKYGAVLTAAGGRAAWYYPTCPAMSAFILNSFTSLLTTGLHVALSILVLDALRRESLAGGALAVSTHLVFSAVGALTAVQDGCIAVLPVQALVLLVAGYASLTVVTASDYSARRQLRAWTAVQQAARGEYRDTARFESMAGQQAR